MMVIDNLSQSQKKLVGAAVGGQNTTAGPNQDKLPPILSGQTASRTTSLCVSSDDESSTRIALCPDGLSQAANQQKAFPQALMEMLSQEDPEVITWLPSGDAFIVRNTKKFVDSVLPKFFNQTKITSFQRQLNLYGFRRIVDGPNMGAYHHVRFRRDEPEMCKSIPRKKRIRKRPAPKDASPRCASAKHTSKAPRKIDIDSPSRRSIPTVSPVMSGISSTIADRSCEAVKRSATSSAVPTPSAEPLSPPLTGYSIIVCDHMGKAVAEVAHYSSIPCDLQSFALGVGGLLADGIEQYNRSCSLLNEVPLVVEKSLRNSAPFPMSFPHNEPEESSDYSEEEMDVEIRNMFRNDSLSNLLSLDDF